MSGTIRESGLDADTGFLNGIAHPKQVNLLDVYGGAAEVANKQWANRLNQSREASGQAFLQSMNADGTPNQTGFNQAMRANPATAMTALDSSAKGQTLDAETWAQHMRRLTTGAAGALTVLADNDGTAPRAAINEYYDRAVKDGHITPAQRDQAEAEFTDDPIKNAAIVRQRASQNLSMQQALDANRPEGVMVDKGGTIAPMTRGGRLGPNPGAVAPAGGEIERTTSPETGAALQDVYIPEKTNPDGSPAEGTGWKKVPRPRDQMPGANKPPGRGEPSAFPNGGRNPPDGSPLRNPNAPPPAGGTTATPAPAPEVRSAPPQGQPEQVASNVGAYQAAVAAVPDQKKNVIAGESALEALHLTRGGPSTAKWQQIRSFAQTYGIPIGSSESAENYDLARKNLLRFAQNQSKASGTDLGLETTLHSSANVTDMVQSAAEHVVIQDLGIARQRIAQTLEAPARGDNYGEHTKSFTGQTDPRGFAWDLYSPEQRATILKDAKGTKGGEEKLNRAIELADKHGLIRVPNQRAAKPAPTTAAPAAAPNLLEPR